MKNEIEKPEQPNPDDVLAAIQSFNDPSIITNLFRELGWTYSFEIKETITMAKQNANLSIKFKAIKHLRELLREAAETSGLVANVSQTVPNAQGGYTTFHAKRIASILNPTKQIESTIKESQNDQTKETRTEPNRGSDRGQSETKGQSCRPAGECSIDSCSSKPERDTGRAFLIGDVDSGGTESSDGEETPRPVSKGESDSGRKANPESDETDNENINESAGKEKQERDNNNVSNPCIKTRPPTCNQDLFPGIASAED